MTEAIIHGKENRRSWKGDCGLLNSVGENIYLKDEHIYTGDETVSIFTSIGQVRQCVCMFRSRLKVDGLGSRWACFRWDLKWELGMALILLVF